MRTLIPVTQMSPQQQDVLREFIQTDLMAKAARDNPTVTKWVTRQLLPWTDLAIVSAGQAGALTDYWGTGALVASTLLAYVNHQLDSNEYVAIYGVAIRDTNPATLKILFQTAAGASTKANWNLEIMYGAQEPEVMTPEYIYYKKQDTVFIQLLPDSVGKAVGADGVADHVVLEGLMCKPSGEVVSF